MSNESGTYVGVAIVCKNAPSDLWDILCVNVTNDVMVYAVRDTQYVVSLLGAGIIHDAFSYEEKVTEIESVKPAVTDFLSHHASVFKYIKSELNIDCYLSLVALNWCEH